MSQRTWNEHPEARDELLAEADRLPPDIADQLVDNVAAAIQDILDGPESWPIVHYWDEQPTLRWRRIKRFRIRVVYCVAENEVRVVAYAHEAREPGYWRSRLAGNG